jgi:hypothetical protein
MVPSDRHTGYLADHRLGKISTDIATPILSMENIHGNF